MRDDEGAATQRTRVEEPAVPALAALGPGGGSDSGDPPEVRMDDDGGSRGQRRSADEAGMDLEDLAQSQSATEAVGEAHMLGDLGIEAADFAELSCPGKFAAAVGAYHLTPGSAFDLRTGWDLTTAEGQATC